MYILQIRAMCSLLISLCAYAKMCKVYSPNLAVFINRNVQNAILIWPPSRAKCNFTLAAFICKDVQNMISPPLLSYAKACKISSQPRCFHVQSVILTRLHSYARKLASFVAEPSAWMHRLPANPIKKHTDILQRKKIMPALSEPQCKLQFCDLFLH